MPQIKCCQYCIPPKRRIGCHAYCPDYIIERADKDVRNAAHLKWVKQNENLVKQRFEAVQKATKKKRGNKYGR